jgi:hypothetical protein
MYAILTAATGREFSLQPGFQVILKSIRTCNLQGDVVLLTNDMDENIQQIVKAYEYQTIEVDMKKIRNIAVDRFLIFYEFLCGKTYDAVLLTDSKDVYFQGNPFDHLQPKDSLLLCSEGGKIHQNEWNTIDQLKCQDELLPIYQQDLNEQTIINSGFILGRTETIKNLCLQIWLTTLRTQYQFTDQACLNYLYHFLQKDPSVRLLSPHDSTYCATGQGITQGWFSAEWRNGLLYHPPTGKPYAAYHQWNRVPEHKQGVLAETGLAITLS